ncbi:MAG TPA: V-type ATP synthase subunit E family protein [Anaerohalosphaeraceae bacterium]|jgi:V/A-type H+-transporting ATPase subunit E|nr:V-type ATP synthase subunit E family protein [Anaerohalosphaeraceae bacterium]
MKAEQVVEKILSQAQQEAQAILDQARSRIQQRRADLQGSRQNYAQQTEEKAKTAGEDKLARMLAAARMDLQKKRLAAKVDLLNEVFEKARQKINALPEEAYLDLMSRLIMKAVQTGDEEVLVGAQETRINQKCIKQINQKLGPGFKGNLRLSDEKADIDGGFILRRGNVRINASTGVLIEQMRQDLEIDLAAELFAE